MLGKKAQNAIEYLVAYSWLILATIIIITFVFYMGVFATGGVVPPSCTLPAPLSCITFKLSNGTGYLDLRIRQNNIHPIKVTRLKCTKESSTPTANWTTVNVSIDINEEKWIANTAALNGAPNRTCCFQEDGTTCYPDPRKGQSYTGRLWLEYNETDTGVIRMVTGDLTANYE